MLLICLDLEGVLVPEIWIEVARRFKCRELLLTTRDIPDYDKLMKYRINILRSKGIQLKDIQSVIRKIKPLPGAQAFLNQLREKVGAVVILSDTFYEFAAPLMKQLGYPALLCNSLKIDAKGFISGHVMRQSDGKTKAVKAFQSTGMKVYAAGDSFNDLGMLRTAHKGILFNPPISIKKKYKQFPAVTRYTQLLRLLTASYSR